MENKKRWRVFNEDGEDRACSFGSIQFKDKGWETDSGHWRYGLALEMAQYICDILNEHGDSKKEKKLEWHPSNN